MTAEEAIAGVYRGSLVECSEEEYRTSIRKALQLQAGKWIDEEQFVCSMIALLELRRLDTKWPNKNLFAS